ncbi:MAG: shikimate dehydrogenase [Casimicrobiaceae bacterium]
MSAANVPRACVIGHPIAHSRSPLIHGHWLAELGIAGAYEKMDVPPDAFPDFLTHLRANGYVGANVTVPHKQVAYRLVERRDPAAEAVGAVNTIWYEGDVLCGGNSDVHGFIANLDQVAPGWDVANARAVVLGAGGAAHAAAFGLAMRGVAVAVVNRTEARARELASSLGHGISAHGMAELPQLLAAADVLANCTSLGMVHEPPLAIDLGPLKATAVVCDAVYVPLETALLTEAAARGHRIVDGLGMLLQQAGYGFRKWFGATPTVTAELRELIVADIHAGTARLPKR